METDLSIEITGIQLQSPVMNAAGTCKFLEGREGVRELARSATAAIVIGTITFEKREGESGETFWSNDLFSLNAVGWANPGKAYYDQYLPVMVDIARKANKPLIVNVGGFSSLEYAALTEFAFQKGADLIELCLSCPNLWEKERQKRIVCFNPQLVEEILFSVEKKVGPEAKVAVKLSPFSDPFNLNEVAQVISQSRVVKVVVTSNTYPNAFDYGKGRPRISPKDGLAGMGGPALKPIALGQVRQLRKMLPERIDIIGVGGITRGQDILDYQQAGAVAIQTATAFLQRGTRIFSNLLTELVDLR